MMDACQSHRPGIVCADGFIQKPICSGHVGCVHCGRTDEKHTPNCQKDDLPEHWLKGDGSPLFYREPQP